MKPVLACVLSSLFTLVLVGQGDGVQQARQADLTREHAPSDILFRVKETPTPELLSGLGVTVNAVKAEALWPGLIYRMVLAPGVDLRWALQTLNADPRVEYAEPNYLHRADGYPNDPYFSQQWGWHQGNDADVDAPEAWDVMTDAGGIIVGIIDTGIDYNHVDLQNNMWRNPGEVPGNGIDDDQNGWVDDVYGIDAYNNDGDPWDDNHHGTHVAGTVGADTNNGIGVAGACWNVQLLALKFLGADGTGYDSGAITCLYYGVSKGAYLTNNSWGGGDYNQAVRDAIDAAGDAGQLFCAAAGNRGRNNDLRPYYPGSYDLPEIVAVAATTAEDQLASFSNYGPTSVDLGAPGEGIYSTWPGDCYDYLSGTSMATPHVTGTAALLYARGLGSNPVAIKDRILRTVDIIPALAGKVVSHGRLNMDRAVRCARIYVDGNYSGPEDGSEERPYNTVAEGVAAVFAGEEVRVKSNIYPEALTIDKWLTLQARDGTVVIGW
ncbi:MAG: S8 family peptidase [Planctomycetota bacterium]